MALAPLKDPSDFHRAEMEARFDQMHRERQIAAAGLLPDYLERTHVSVDLPQMALPQINIPQRIEELHSNNQQIHFPYGDAPFQDRNINPIKKVAYPQQNFNIPTAQMPFPIMPTINKAPLVLPREAPAVSIPQIEPPKHLEVKKRDEFVFDQSRVLDFGGIKTALFYENMMKSYHASKYLNERQKQIIFDFPDSQYMSLGNKEFKYGSFVFANGMCNELDYAKKTTTMLSDYTGGYRAHLLYNGSQSFSSDLRETILNKAGFITPPVALYMNFIIQHAEQKPGQKIFIACHSQGNPALKVALKHLPESMRDLLIIRSYGGASYIPQTLCKDSINYISKKDWVARIATMSWLISCARVLGIKMEAEDAKVEFLEPDDKAPLIDHGVQGKTYQDQLEFDVMNAIEKMEKAVNENT